MSVINTNVSALRSTSALAVNNLSMQTSMQRLSTGLRINSASDDAAGLAISQKMTAQIRGLDQAVRNANDGISLLQTAEGDMGAVGAAMQRMRELAVQASNGTNSGNDIAALQTEFGAMIEEIDRVANNSQFNNLTIGGGTFTFQIGANNTPNDSITITIDAFDAATLGVDAGSVDLTTGAAAAIDAIDAGLQLLNTGRALMGSTQNRLSKTVESLQTTSTNMSAARSRIQDTDYAKETTNLARTQIIQQAGTAMLAQANQAPQTVLALLK